MAEGRAADDVHAAERGVALRFDFGVRQVKGEAQAFVLREADLERVAGLEYVERRHQQRQQADTRSGGEGANCQHRGDKRQQVDRQDGALGRALVEKKYEKDGTQAGAKEITEIDPRDLLRPLGEQQGHGGGTEKERNEEDKIKGGEGEPLPPVPEELEGVEGNPLREREAERQREREEEGEGGEGFFGVAPA